MKTPTVSLAIGTAAALLLFGLGYLAAETNAMALSYLLYWQAWVLYQLVPCTYVSFLEDALCQSEKVSMIVFYAGIPVGIIVYSLAAWGTLTWLNRRPKATA